MEPKQDRVQGAEGGKEPTGDKYEGWTPNDFYKHFGNWSKAARALKGEGLTTRQIANKLDKIYQHIRNILNQPVKRSK